MFKIEYMYQISINSCFISKYFYLTTLYSMQKYFDICISRIFLLTDQKNIK